MRIYHQSPQNCHRPRAKLFVFLVVSILLILIIGGGYLVYASSFFKIKTIEVIGADDFSKEILLTELKDFFKSKSKIAAFLGAENIFIWDTETGEFLLKHPQLKNLEIEKNIFAKSIKIRAKEREKFGIWCFEGVETNQSLGRDDYKKDCYWFDKEGMLFIGAPVIEGELFNRVIDSTQRSLNLGDKVLAEPLLENLIKIYDVFDAVNLKSKTIFINNLKTEEAIVMPADFPKVLFSLRFDPSFSIAAINELRKSGRWEKIEYVDFRVENKAFYKFK